MDTPKHQRSLEFKPVCVHEEGYDCGRNRKIDWVLGERQLVAKGGREFFFMGCRVVPYVEKLKNKL